MIWKANILQNFRRFVNSEKLNLPYDSCKHKQTSIQAKLLEVFVLVVDNVACGTEKNWFWIYNHLYMKYNKKKRGENFTSSEITWTNRIRSTFDQSDWSMCYVHLCWYLTIFATGFKSTVCINSGHAHLIHMIKLRFDVT